MQPHDLVARSGDSTELALKPGKEHKVQPDNLHPQSALQPVQVLL